MNRRQFSTSALALFAVGTIPLTVPLRAAEALKGQIYYARKSGATYRIHVMNADGTGDKELPGQTGNVNIFPVLSPDGKKIAFMSGPGLEQNEFQLMIGKSDGTGLNALQTGSKITGLAAWSPDGSKVAYVSGDMRPSVFLGDADGNNGARFTDENVGGLFPFFSPDGKKLYYSRMSEAERSAPIEVKPVAGGAAEAVIPAADGVCFATANGLSKDGKKLVYTVVKMEDKSASVRLRNLETGGETFLTEIKLGDQAPGPEAFPAGSWSPDGKWIIYSASSEKGFGIFRSSEDGQTKVRITPEGTDCITPSWYAPK